MKKLLIFAPLVFLLFSCSHKLLPIERKVYTSYFDFSKYANEGFFISPNMYSGDYEPKGELIVTIFPAQKEQTESHPFYGREFESKSIQPETIANDELLLAIVDNAKAKGANALVNFSSKVFYKTVMVNKMPVEELSHYELRGFAIERK